MSTPEIAKLNMIEQQIRPWEVLDNKVLSTLRHIDRADYVRDAYKGLAYADCQIPLGAGIRMLPPVVEGRLLQALLIEADDEVLEIGSGSGYLAACLAQLSARVTSIDIDGDVIDFARDNISHCNVAGVDFRQVDAFSQELDKTYDVIAVTRSVEQIPDNLTRALNTGGRMFVVVGQSPVMQALLITRISDVELSTRSLFETDLPRLAH